MLLVSAIPISSASWRGYLADGNSEPNTKWDLPSVMFANPNDAAGANAVDHIYFDVHVQKLAVVPIVPSPNVEGSGLRNYGVSYFTADLGYWRDCNDDDFIGDAVTGANKYPLEFGIDEAICPPNTAYNDGTFAYEFLAIGPLADSDATSVPSEATGALCDNGVLCLRGAWNAIRDDAASVVHDWNTAADLPAATRLLLPFPQGTMTDTNGHFQYVDSLTFGSLSGSGGAGCKLQTEDGSTSLCWLWPSSQANGAPEANGRATAAPNQCDASDPVGSLVTGLGAAPGPNPDCPDGSSPIPNVPDPVTSTVRDRWNDSASPGGTGPSGTPIVEPWDYGVRGDRDAGNDVCELRTSPTDWELNPDGAVYPTLDLIYRATVSAQAGEGGACSNKPADQAPGIPQIGTNFELPATPSDVAGKKASDSGFVFFADASFNPSETAGAADVEGCLPTTQANVPWQGASQDLSGRCGGMWTGGAQWLHAHGVTVLNPAPLATFVASFYADVNFADVFGGGGEARFNAQDPSGAALVPNNPATALPGGANNVHTYGEENCDVGRGNSETGFWVCDPLVWINEAGLDPGNPDDAEAIFLLYKPGKGFDLRDVECYDNSVADTSINALAGQSFDCADMVDPIFS